MIEWSKYIQSARDLDTHRKYTLNEELRPQIKKWFEMKEGMKILDLGCGSGAFTRFLAETMDNIKVYGVDTDKTNIGAAIETSKKLGLESKTEFVVGDALKLPFEDASFDLVTSHMVLGLIKDNDKVMREMIRVCKSGGLVTSINGMHGGDQSFNKGHYEKLEWIDKLDEMDKVISEIIDKVLPLSKIQCGISVSEIPHSFAVAGLKNVRVHAYGKVFSLSNSAMSKEYKEEYLRVMCDEEIIKIKNYCDFPEVRETLSEEFLEEYFDLVIKKRDYHLEKLDDNLIWAFTGGANLVTIGDKVSNEVRG